MFEIKYTNCHKVHDEEKQTFVFIPFDKNNQIMIKFNQNELIFKNKLFLMKFVEIIK